MRDTFSTCSRRQFLTGLVALPFVSVVSSCTAASEPLFRFGAQIFPGYEFLFLARELGLYEEEQIRLVETPNASSSLHALSAGTLDGAALTLDEVLLARSQGLPLVVIAVLDKSVGADVFMAGPQVPDLQQLKGKRIGVEETAVGAVMLDAVLAEAQLTIHDVKLVYTSFNEHVESWENGEVDALVTYEPVKTQLAEKGLVALYSSTSIPDRIIDVIAVTPKAIATMPNALTELLAGNFAAYEQFRTQQASVLDALSKRLHVSVEDIPAVFTGLEMQTADDNHQWLTGTAPRIVPASQNLMEVMIQGKLLAGNMPLNGLTDARFLP